MKKGIFAVGLENPKTDWNVGGVGCACHCYGASALMIRGNRYKKDCRDTSKAYNTFPIFNCDDLISSIPFSFIPVAVEISPLSKDLVTFNHPMNAFYIFGPENNSLSKEILDSCAFHVMIDTRICMNLASCVNVVLYDRLSKIKRNYLDHKLP